MTITEEVLYRIHLPNQLRDTMRKSKLLIEVERKLRRPLPQVVWRWLEEDQHVHAAETDAEGFRYLVDEARKHLRRMKELEGQTEDVIREGASQPDSTAKPEFNAVRGRQFAISRFRENVATAIAAGFRKKALGGETLDDLLQVLKFLNSPAVRCFPFSWFKKHGVPVRKHRVVPDDKPPAGLFVDPPGRRFAVESGPSYCLSFEPPGRRFDDFFVWRGSVVDRLVQVARRLSGYFGWSLFRAVEFVLTGNVPSSRLVAVESRIGRSVKGRQTGLCYADSFGAALTLTVEPWVPAEEVARVYRQAQRIALRQRKSRSLNTKNLSVFSVVMGLRDLNGEGPSWRAMMDGWNASCRKRLKTEDWLYSNVQNFWRDYDRTKKALLFPTYDLSRFPALGSDSADDIEV